MMSKVYIATFHTHFGAMQLHRRLKADRVESLVMPVPRSLSSSCGICVRFISESPLDWQDAEDLEQIVLYEQGKPYTVLFHKDD